MKNKKENMSVSIMHEGKAVFLGNIYDIPISEEKIIAGSIEIYDDPEPCMIHRSAILSRYYTQIESWLSEKDFQYKAKVCYCDIPENIRDLIDFNVLN